MIWGNSSDQGGEIVIGSDKDKPVKICDRYLGVIGELVLYGRVPAPLGVLQYLGVSSSS